MKLRVVVYLKKKIMDNLEWIESHLSVSRNLLPKMIVVKSEKGWEGKERQNWRNEEIDYSQKLYSCGSISYH